MVVLPRLFFIVFALQFAGMGNAYAQAFWNKPDAPKVIRDAFVAPDEPVQPKKRSGKKQQKPRVVAIPDDLSRQAPGLPQTAYRVEEPKTRGLFQILFGAREEAQPFREEQAPVNRPQNVFVDPDEAARSVSYGNRTVCVRLCDGAFMPISTGRSTGRERDADVCQAQCPGAETKVYSFRGDNIEDAETRDGESYLSLANANKFKNAHDKTCSCRPQGKSWAEYAASLDDPTLRGGDKFLTEKQAKQMALAPQSRKNSEDVAKITAKQLEESAKELDLKPELQTGTVRVIEVGAAKRVVEAASKPQATPLIEETKGLNPVERLLLERNIRRPAPAQKSGEISKSGREG